MNIHIDERTLKIEGHPLEYDAYYFDADEYAGLSNSEVLKVLLSQWAKAISESAAGQMLYLPFSFDDEYVECVEADVAGDKVSLRHVWVRENGYAVDVVNLSAFMATSHEINSMSPNRPLGVYGREELVSALLNPTVGDA